jgi:hypothetical protein
MADQEVQVQQKREVEKKQESTVPLRSFLPVSDIFETDHALNVVLEMPGVAKDNVEIGIDNDVLKISGPNRYRQIRGASTGLYGIQHRQLQSQFPAFEQGRSGRHQGGTQGWGDDAGVAEVREGQVAQNQRELNDGVAAVS